jgi:hypothetical protein
MHHLKTLGSRTVTLKMQPTVGPHILSNTLKYVVVMATRRQEFLHPCCRALGAGATGCFLVNVRVPSWYGAVDWTVSTNATKNA